MDIQITSTIIQVSLVLIIVGLILSNWEPPIKAQYRAMLMITIGGTLGHYLGCGIIWGVIIAGLVFFKDKLVEEVKLVRGSFNDIKDKKSE